MSKRLAALASAWPLKNVAACGGSWMVKGELISAGKFEEITRLTAEAVRVLLGFTLAHVGINEEKAEDASKSVDLFSRLFRFPVAEGRSSYFLGQKEFEIMKTHTTLGRDAIIAAETGTTQDNPFFRYAKEIAYSHQEK